MKRRHFLQGIGGVTLAAPFLSSTIRTSIAATNAPKRLVLFHTPGGCITTRFFPTVEDGSLSAKDLMGTTLEALAPTVSQLLIPRGITAINGFSRPQSLEPHVQAMGSKLTCALIDEQTQLATSHSLDHEVARQLNLDGQGPLFVNPGWSGGDPMTYLSFAASGKPAEPETNPRTILNSLTLGSSSASPMPQELLRQSALDVVRDDLLRFQAVDMSQSDRLRVQTWLDLVRQTEEKTTGVACSATSAASLGLTDERVDEVTSGAVEASERAVIRGDVLMDLMALAMLCDANRSLLFSYPSYITFNWDGIQHDADLDGLNHRTGSPVRNGPCFPDVLTKLEQADQWFAGKFYRLVSLLASIPEGETNLLDNTVTLWFREFSDGAALNVNNMPLVIAGSGGGYLKQGAAVLLEDEPIGPGNSEASCTEPGGEVGAFTGTDPERGIVPINKLYVTLMNAVGCLEDGGPVTQFGVFDGPTAEAGLTDRGELTALRS